MENLVKIVFEIIENNNSLKIITQKVGEIKVNNFGEHYKNEHKKLKKKYPKIDFKIDFKKDETTFKKIIQDENFQVNLKTPLEKLFYAILWKQGDLTKIKHILKGIKDDEPHNAFVFHQFGRFLSIENEPIIDQHTLRSFAYFKNENQFYSISEINKSHLDLIESYKCFIQEKLEHIEGDKNEILFEIDRILFILGRLLKENSNKKHTK